jgi:hypothetical protein
MQKQIQYIAFFLAGVFLFPIVYQNIHILGHREYSDRFGTHSHPNKTILGEKQAPCYICDYEFVTFQVPDINPYTFVSFDYVLVSTPSTLHICVGFNGNHVSLRAPPVLA